MLNELPKPAQPEAAERLHGIAVKKIMAGFPLC
jgi:hypothetical protein